MTAKRKNDLPEKMPSVSGTEGVILELLLHHDELYGLEMIAKQPTLKRGTIYVLLDRMEDKGLISSREVDPPPGARGPSRRIYKLTGLGTRVGEVRRLSAMEWQRGLLGAG